MSAVRCQRDARRHFVTASRARSVHSVRARASEEKIGATPFVFFETL